MDFELILALLVMVVWPVWYNTNLALKKKRNFFISLILATLLILSIYLGMFFWFLSMEWSWGFFIEDIDITKWIGIPLVFVGSMIGAIMMYLFIAIFGFLFDNYADKGIFKINLFKVPNFIKKYFSK